MPKKQKTKKSKSKSSKNWNKSFDFIVIGGALAIFIITFIIRVYSISSPIMGDEASYYVLGTKAIAGYRPYLDFYEMKPPLLFYSYGIGSLIYGFSDVGLRVFGFSLALLNAFLLGMIAKKFVKIQIAGLIASIVFFMLINIYTYGIETVSEHFVLFYTLIGINIILYPFIQKTGLKFLIAGAFIASSALVKQTGALFGIATALWILIDGFVFNHFFQRKNILKSLLFLALGALLATLVWMIPVAIGGGLAEVKYWLIDFPSTYTSQIGLERGMFHQRVFGRRIFLYQPFTIGLCLVALITLFIQWRKNYFVPFVLILLASYITLYPGMRFYGQYWIPLSACIPLMLIPLYDLVRKYKFEFLLPLLVIISFSVDLTTHSSEYFEEGYLLNSEQSHSGNYPSVMQSLIEDIKSRIQPHQSFIMLGAYPQAYVELGRMTKSKHFYPRLISRTSDKNKIFQEEAYNHYIQSDYDYLIFSVTGLGWGVSSNFDNTLYQRCFNFTLNNYRPLLAFNYDEMKYYNAELGEEIDLYKPNQIISFVKR